VTVPPRTSLLAAAAAGVLALTLTAPARAAGDAAAGKGKALQCQTCHGLDGMAKLPQAPNLAGQNPVYLVKALNDFKSGAREDKMMSIVVQSLSARDIENLAAYYSSLAPKTRAPQ